MTIIRRAKNGHNPYVMVSRHALQDSRLSWEARGILGYLLSKPDDWQISTSELINSGNSGQHVITRILAELESAGYLERHRRQDKSGKFIWEKVLHEYPVTKTIRPYPDYPSMDNPSMDNPSMDNRPIYIRKAEQKNEQQKKTAQQSAALSLAPSAFWRQSFPADTHENTAQENEYIDQHIQPDEIAEWRVFLAECVRREWDLAGEYEGAVTLFREIQSIGWIQSENG